MGYYKNYINHSIPYGLFSVDISFGDDCVLIHFKIGDIPKWGWVLVSLCLPSVALFKTIEEYL